MVQFIRQVAPQKLVQKLTTMGEERDKMLNMMRNINWSKPKVYCPSVSGGIFINSDDLGKYRSIREEIIGKLSQIRHPDTGEPLGLELYRKEDIYHGEYCDKAPDIAIAAGGKYYHVALGSKDFG